MKFKKEISHILDSIIDQVEYGIQQYQPISEIERSGFYIYLENPSTLVIKKLAHSDELKMTKCTCSCTLRIENLSVSRQQKKTKAQAEHEPYFYNHKKKSTKNQLGIFVDA